MLDIATLTPTETAIIIDWQNALTGLRLDLERQISALRTRIEFLEERIDAGSGAGKEEVK